MCFCLGEFVSLEDYLWFFNEQGGICNRMLSCIFVTESANLWRIGSIQRPNCLMFIFLFVHTVLCIYS